jgi:hypothetical protein
VKQLGKPTRRICSAHIAATEDLASRGLAMAFKLIEAAQARGRAVNAPHLVALVRAGARFEAGKLVERPDEHPQPEARVAAFGVAMVSAPAGT